MRFPYTAANDSSASLMPRLALTLEVDGQTVDVIGLVDTGSTVNVLPYSVGLALGGDWNEHPIIPSLSGSLAHLEVRAFAALASHPQLTPHSPVRLVFAWAQTDNAPILFGQMNFFMEFDVCFYRSQNVFDVTPKIR